MLFSAGFILRFRVGNAPRESCTEIFGLTSLVLTLFHDFAPQVSGTSVLSSVTLLFLLECCSLMLKMAKWPKGKHQSECNAYLHTFLLSVILSCLHWLLSNNDFIYLVHLLIVIFIWRVSGHKLLCYNWNWKSIFVFWTRPHSFLGSSVFFGKLHSLVACIDTFPALKPVINYFSF